MCVIIDKWKGENFGLISSTGTLHSPEDLGIFRIIFDSPDTFHYLVKKDDGFYVIEEKIE